MSTDKKPDVAKPHRDVDMWYLLFMDNVLHFGVDATERTYFEKAYIAYICSIRKANPETTRAEAMQTMSKYMKILFPHISDNIDMQVQIWYKNTPEEVANLRLDQTYKPS